MNTLADLLAHKPAIFVHLLSMLGAVLVGAMLLLRRKGTLNHRAWGWSWVVLIAVAAVSSLFIRNHRGVNIGGYTPIHLLTLVVVILVPLGIVFARRGRISGHRKTMSNVYVGGCIVAGAFTLMPGRLLGDLVWRQWLGLLA